MERAGVEAAQQLGFERLHPTLGARGVRVGIATYFDQVQNAVRLSYADLPWPLVARAVGELTGVSEPARGLGAFAGAFGAVQASSLELSFRAEPPVAARISVDT